MNAGDTAWLLASAALVLLMTPALALFYGGMVRKKNVLSTIMHSLSAIPLVTVVWVTFGYSLAFGKSHHGLIGGFEFIGLISTTNQTASGRLRVSKCCRPSGVSSRRP